jgi:primosomal protein N' (replication factor Y)
MRVEVALPLPVPRTFTYEVDDEHAVDGIRVRVPFSGRKLIGWIVGPALPQKELARVRPVERVLDDAPAVPPDVMRLCRWVAEYYLAPLGIVLRTALPTALSQPKRENPPARTRRLLRLTRELDSLIERDALFGRAARQRAAWEFLESTGGSADVAHMTGQLGFSPGVLGGLVTKGLAEFIEERVDRDPFAERVANTESAPTPTPHQHAAIARIVAPSPGSAPQPVLLFGVTGSGKTLVYTEVLQEIVALQGRGAIVLVPEIALTPQTVARFRARFGDAVAVLHSALSEGERYDAWLALRAGRKKIAIGARSAVFAPVQNLGILIVDEEHEATYKQSDAPRYHAREVAVMRARLAGARCVLGSATPALESWQNASIGKYELLELPERIAGRPLPPVRIIDMRGASRTTGRARSVLDDSLAAAIDQRLQRAEQVILLLNRRGYASFVQCRDCGHVWQCRRCNVSMTFHRGRRRLVCHYCFNEEVTPVSCVECGSGDLSFRGVGTEQVERAVAEMFPQARIARMDVDTTSGKWAHQHILDRVAAREIDILLGTQMIAKGLDFPTVTLVGVINADVAMNLPDFRATERTFQLLTQVAGRAGRGPLGGEVFIQTALPGHYAIRSAVTHDYRGFAERELSERAGPGHPPHMRLANVLITGSDEKTVQDAAEDTARWTLDYMRRLAADEVQLAGPAPCPIDRIRGRWRWHFILRSRKASPLSAVCQHIQQRAIPSSPAQLRVLLDRDPVTLL